jgi:hypothetical protein
MKLLRDYVMEIQQCGCEEGTVVQVKNVETDVYLCFTCGYAGVTPSERDFGGEGEIHIGELIPALKEIKRLQKRNGWLEEIVALLQEDGINLAEEGYPIWEIDGSITRRG